MQKNILHFAYVAIVISAMFTSCKKAEVTVSATDPQLAFAVQTDQLAFTFPQTGASTGKISFLWTDGNANITQFKLDAKRGGIASTYTAGALSNIDLFGFNKAFSNTSIPKGDYTEAKATVVFSQTSTTPYPLTLKGTFTTASATVIPTEFDLNDNLEVRIPVINIIADGTKNFTTNIWMHLSILLNGISAQDIDGAARINGTILINKTNNITLYAKMKGNISVCAGAVLSSTAK